MTARFFDFFREQNMQHMTRLAAAASLTALLAACGGGGGETSTTPAVPPISSRLVEVPAQTTATNAHPLGSQEAEAFARLNRARTECGFGALQQDARLDKAADNHAKYMIAERMNAGHVQDNLANPFFTGREAEDRATYTGYRNATGSNAFVSEGIDPGPGTSRSFNNAHRIAGLLNAPYHALDLLAPYQHSGIGIQWPDKAGFPDRYAGTQDHDQVLVATFGSQKNANGQITIQSMPTNDVLTWPCSATTEKIVRRFTGEYPDPFNNTRNYFTNPVGTPFYVAARHGSGLRVTTAKLTHIATGKVVPLLPTRHSDTDFYPGTNLKWRHADLMDWAIIFPDEGLDVGKYRMEITATVFGKTVTKVSEFTTVNSLTN